VFNQLFNKAQPQLRHAATASLPQRPSGRMGDVAILLHRIELMPGVWVGPVRLGALLASGGGVLAGLAAAVWYDFIGRPPKRRTKKLR